MKKLLLAATALLAAASASASIIPTLSGAPTDAGDGTFLYSWSATLASDQALLTGSYFTLYDVVGFDRFGTLPTGFTGTTQLLGTTPVNVVPDDDPTLLNLTFTYSGPSVNFDGPLSERELGDFQAYATAGTFGFGDFTAQAVRNSGPTRGTLLANIGLNAVGIPGSTGVIPEPSAWGMLIVGFALVGTNMRRRSSNRTVVA